MIRNNLTRTTVFPQINSIYHINTITSSFFFLDIDVDTAGINFPLIYANISVYCFVAVKSKNFGLKANNILLAADDVQTLTRAKYGNFEFHSWQKTSNQLIVGARKTGDNFELEEKKTIFAFQLSRNFRRKIATCCNIKR